MGLEYSVRYLECGLLEHKTTMRGKLLRAARAQLCREHRADGVIDAPAYHSNDRYQDVKGAPGFCRLFDRLVLYGYHMSVLLSTGTEQNAP
jgi:hypothetical protein